MFPQIVETGRLEIEVQAKYWEVELWQGLLCEFMLRFVWRQYCFVTRVSDLINQPFTAERDAKELVVMTYACRKHAEVLLLHDRRSISDWSSTDQNFRNVVDMTLAYVQWKLGSLLSEVINVSVRQNRDNFVVFTFHNDVRRKWSVEHEDRFEDGAHNIQSPQMPDERNKKLQILTFNYQAALHTWNETI